MLGRLLRDHQPAYPGEWADRLLARGIDVQHRDLVRPGQGRAELRRERLGARVEVGLEGRDHAAGPELASRLDRRGDLRRMVGVIVVDAGAISLPLELEPPRHAWIVT